LGGGKKGVGGENPGKFADFFGGKGKNSFYWAPAGTPPRGGRGGLGGGGFPAFFLKTGVLNFFRLFFSAPGAPGEPLLGVNFFFPRGGRIGIFLEFSRGFFFFFSPAGGPKPPGGWGGFPRGASLREGRGGGPPKKKTYGIWKGGLVSRGTRIFSQKKLMLGPKGNCSGPGGKGFFSKIFFFAFFLKPGGGPDPGGVSRGAGPPAFPQGPRIFGGFSPPLFFFQKIRGFFPGEPRFLGGKPFFGFPPTPPQKKTPPVFFREKNRAGDFFRFFFFFFGAPNGGPPHLSPLFPPREPNFFREKGGQKKTAPGKSYRFLANFRGAFFFRGRGKRPPPQKRGVFFLFFSISLFFIAGGFLLFFPGGFFGLWGETNPPGGKKKKKKGGKFNEGKKCGGGGARPQRGGPISQKNPPPGGGFWDFLILIFGNPPFFFFFCWFYFFKKQGLRGKKKPLGRFVQNGGGGPGAEIRGTEVPGKKPPPHNPVGGGGNGGGGRRGQVPGKAPVGFPGVGRGGNGEASVFFYQGGKPGRNFSPGVFLPGKKPQSGGGTKPPKGGRGGVKKF